MNKSPDWVTSGDELKADPSSLRGFAKNVATIAENLLSDVNGPMRTLFTDDMKFRLGTGQLQAGAAAMAMVADNQRAIQQFLNDEYKTLLADSSAFHTLADCYETGANNHGISLSAIQWVYQEKGGRKPPGAGLSHLYDKDGKLLTMNELYKETGEPVKTNGIAGETVIGGTCLANGTVITTYRTADGGTRKVTERNGERTEVVTNAKGEILFKTVSNEANRTTTTTRYSNGKVAGSTTVTRTRTADCPTSGPRTTHETTTYVEKDANGKVLHKKEDHVEYKYDPKDNRQTEKRYTVENGKLDKDSERNFGKQPRPVTQDDWRKLAEEDAKKSEALLRS